VLAATLAFASHRLRRGAPGAERRSSEAVDAMQRSGSKVETPAILDRAPAFAPAVGIRLAPALADRLSHAALQKAFDVERAQLQERLGLPFPGITMWIAADLEGSRCELRLFDVPQAAFELPPSEVMLPDVRADATGRAPDAAAAAEGVQARPSTTGDDRPSFWIEEQRAPAGARAWRAEQVIAASCIALMSRHASQFLGIQEVQWILDQLGADYPTLVAELQKVLPPQRVADVLRRLLEEQVPIRNVRGIVESLIAWGPKEKDMLMLTEYVRVDMARYLAHRAAGGARTLDVVLLDLSVEQRIRGAIKQTPTGNFLALPPADAAYLVDSIEALLDDRGGAPVAVVTSMDIRRYVRRLIAARLPEVAVHSYQEFGDHLELKPIGRVAL
jgi:type III secretion protein V